MAGRILSRWIPLAVGLTGIFAFTYMAVQQSYRQSLNDPQIQIAEDAAVLITQTGAPASAVPHGTGLIDIAASLAPWVVVYDKTGMPLESSGVLDGAPPKLPVGLFDDSTWLPNKIHVTEAGKEVRVTWQPRDGVRQAVVLVEFEGKTGTQFVASGRNMREGENREAELVGLAALLWGSSLFASLLAVVFIVVVVE